MECCFIFCYISTIEPTNGCFYFRPRCINTEVFLFQFCDVFPFVGYLVLQSNATVFSIKGCMFETPSWPVWPHSTYGGTLICPAYCQSDHTVPTSCLEKDTASTSSMTVSVPLSFPLDMDLAHLMEWMQQWPHIHSELSSVVMENSFDIFVWSGASN